MKENNDEQLMQAFCNGDNKAFDILYDRHKGGVFRYVRRLSNNGDDESLYQEVWLRVIEKRQQWKAGNPVKPWLYRIAHNLVVDYLRKNGQWNLDEKQELDELTSESKPLDLKLFLLDCIERMKVILMYLPRQQRDAFLLKEEAGLSLADISEINGVGRETVKSRLRYASRQLKQGLEDCQ